MFFILFFHSLTDSLLCKYQLIPSQTTNLRIFQTEFADDDFKFDKNGRMFTKSLGNTAGKGEIARY